MNSKPSENEIIKITDNFIDSVCARLAQNKQVRRRILKNGRLHIDRQLPFFCIYRKPNEREDWGTDRFAVTTASYLLGSASRKYKSGLTSLTERVTETMMEAFGAFLIIEIWAGPEVSSPDKETIPTFRIFKPRKGGPVSTIEALKTSLAKIQIPGARNRFAASVETSAKISPPGMSPILTVGRKQELGGTFLGLEIPPIYRSADGNQNYPINLKMMRRGFHRAIKRTFFEFTRSETDRRPKTYHSIGRRAVVKAVWSVDRILAEVSGSFEFLLLTTPTNADAEWTQFRRNNYMGAPRFSYRPLPFDPVMIKRKLFACPIERIEDPTLSRMFSDIQQELSRKITMLSDRNTKNFLYGSMQVFGAVSDSQLDAANRLLGFLPKHNREKRGLKKISAAKFVELAVEELEHYRKLYPQMSAKVELRKDITGLMVSRGNLLVGTMAPLSELRARALIQHEVGTHVLTYFNGMAQPFKMLQLGLPGYEELQEGLAVLAEYLVGGLDKARVRLLAARVVAIRAMTDGASFQEVFHSLWKEMGFTGRTAFYVTMRVFRGGGLTKDAVYLSGLLRLLDYMGSGGEFEPLFVGKFNIEHVPIIKELMARSILKPMPLQPRRLNEDLVMKRLARIRKRVSVLDLLEGDE